MNFALVPVKALAWGKTRLSRLLSESARHAVSRAMLTDVLTCLQKSSSVDKIVVVSSDATLLALAEAFGAFVVDEEQPRGLNGAVSLGTSFSISKGHDVTRPARRFAISRAQRRRSLISSSERHGQRRDSHALQRGRWHQRPFESAAPCYAALLWRTESRRSPNTSPE